MVAVDCQFLKIPFLVIIEEEPDEKNVRERCKNIKYNYLTAIEYEIHA